MPLSVFSRRRSTPPPVVERELTDAERRAVPRHLEAVAEALVANRCPTAGCAVSGGALAADGVSLREALAMLASTYQGLGLGEPSFAATDALSVAWSEETLAFLGDVSCEDPLTGLASPAHLRARLAEVYRDAEQAGTSPRTTHALVVVDLAASARAACAAAGGTAAAHHAHRTAAAAARRSRVLTAASPGRWPPCAG